MLTVATDNSDLCRFFLVGKCNKQDCGRRHGRPNRETGISVGSLKHSPDMCTHFPKGMCIFGDDCNQTHIIISNGSNVSRSSGATSSSSGSVPRGNQASSNNSTVNQLQQKVKKLQKKNEQLEKEKERKKEMEFTEVKNRLHELEKAERQNAIHLAVGAQALNSLQSEVDHVRDDSRQTPTTTIIATPALGYHPYPGSFRRIYCRRCCTHRYVGYNECGHHKYYDYSPHWYSTSGVILHYD